MNLAVVLCACPTGARECEKTGLAQPLRVQRRPERHFGGLTCDGTPMTQGRAMNRPSATYCPKHIERVGFDRIDVFTGQVEAAFVKHKPVVTPVAFGFVVALDSQARGNDRNRGTPKPFPSNAISYMRAASETLCPDPGTQSKVKMGSRQWGRHAKRGTRRGGSAPI